MELLAFWILAVLALLSASVVVFHRNPVVCALGLALNLASIAGFYMLLNAQFLALLQVIVYAGAIMVLVLFVIMLLNLQDEEEIRGPGFFQKYLGLALAIGFAGLVSRAFLKGTPVTLPVASAEFGTISALGHELFREFFYAFEVISLLEVIEHVPTWQAAVEEALRVASRGVLITVPYREQLQTTVCVHCHQATPLWGHVHAFDESSLDAFADRARIRFKLIPRKPEREHGVLRWIYRSLKPVTPWIGFWLEKRS